MIQHLEAKQDCLRRNSSVKIIPNGLAHQLNGNPQLWLVCAHHVTHHTFTKKHTHLGFSVTYRRVFYKFRGRQYVPQVATRADDTFWAEGAPQLLALLAVSAPGLRRLECHFLTQGFSSHQPQRCQR